MFSVCSQIVHCACKLNAPSSDALLSQVEGNLLDLPKVQVVGGDVMFNQGLGSQTAFGIESLDLNKLVYRRIPEICHQPD